MYDVAALGELLIDFTPKGISTQGNGVFEANPGGAPCNVLSMLSNMGKKTAFIGKVGKDMFGHRLKEVVQAQGIDTTGLCMSETEKTTLAFVHIDETGDRDFSFYRNPGADMMLTVNDLPKDILRNTKIFHFGTLSMTHEGVRAATKAAVQEAKQHGAWISFDPNIRPPLWKSITDARQQMQYGCSQCDILKIEDEELRLLTGKETIEEGIQVVQDCYAIKVIFVTMGAKGSIVIAKGMHVYQDAFLQPQTIDTTGAGDTFYGMCLAYLLDHPYETLTKENLQEMLILSSAAASIITTRMGALKVMPKREEIQTFLQQKS